MSARSPSSVLDGTLALPRPWVDRDAGPLSALPPHRYEVRLWRHGAQWQVGPGGNGESLHFDAERDATRRALELARQAFADHGLLSCVKIFRDGTWEVLQVFGVSPDLTRERRLRTRIAA